MELLSLFPWRLGLVLPEYVLKTLGIIFEASNCSWLPVEPWSAPGCRTGNGGKLRISWFDGLTWLCLVSLHFQCFILAPITVHNEIMQFSCPLFKSTGAIKHSCIPVDPLPANIRQFQTHCARWRQGCNHLFPLLFLLLLSFSPPRRCHWLPSRRSRFAESLTVGGWGGRRAS